MTNVSSTMSNVEFWESLNKKPLGEIFQLQTGSLVLLQAKLTLREALEVLYGNDFSSAPVMQDKETIGVLDCLDIASFVAEYCTKGEQILNTPVQMVMDFSKKNPLFPVYVGSPVEALFRILASGIHRCPIVDGSGNMSAMISQLDVVEFLAKHMDSISQIVNKQLKDIGVLKPVFSVKENEPVIDCMKILKTNKVSALAVLTEEGEVIGAFSSHDVKYVIKHDYSKLYGPLSKWINTAVGWPVALPPDATLGEAISALQTDMVHRLWVVGENNEPVGVVALTDIIRIVVDTYFPKQA